MFKHFQQVSPREYILNARIDKAKQLLLNSSNNIGEIASMLGYRNIYFFSRQFKEKTGSTPKHFRFQN